MSWYRSAALLTATTLALSVGSGIATAGAAPAPAAPGAAAAKNAEHRVIVLLKDQPRMVSPTSASFAVRRSRIRSDQAAIAKQLRSHSKTVRSYDIVNALSATATTSELATLRADDAVAAVIPDEVIRRPAAAAPAEAAAAGPTRPAPSRSCSTTTTPLLEPEALGVTHTESDDPAAKTARSLGYTGRGVKVAYMAEGIDIDNPDFIRADGSHVFSDYQDFSGDGPDAPTDGAEAFIDASAIAAQGRQTYDIKNFSAVPLTTSCPVRVEGMAPGASLVGLKVFAETNATLTSAFLQAIDYAVNTAKVDVLNESFGGNPFPDTVTADAVAQFNAAAVAAGVTVTVSSGDAGPTNTIGSPSTAPGVITVGGSTTYRFYAQTGYGGYYPLAKDGWLNDNISPLSSSGFTQTGRTLDLLAPGDLGYAVCTADAALYYGCTDFTGAPSAIEESGGTSQSAPLTAGAAALVIEAYRKAHHGADPTPALVEKLLTSTADDLGHPAEEQGSGRLNSYQAVLAAVSVHDAKGTPKRYGSSVLTSKTQLDAAALPGSTVSQKVKLTNNGAKRQTLTLGKRTLGPVLDSHTGSVVLSDSASQHFTDFAGRQTNFEVATFSVPKGRARLDVDYVYPADPDGPLNARVRLALIDPRGRFAAHSLPQGVGNAGHVDVRTPASGTWTAMIWSRGSAVGGTVGRIRYRATTHNFVRSGTVSPSSVTLAAGASRTVTVTEKTPATPGDRGDSLTIASSTGRLTSLPIAVRSLINLAGSGTYSGTLTGGNGRPSGGQTGQFQFDVPAGKKDLTADFTLSGKATDPVLGFLVDPAGNAQAYASNDQVTGFDSKGNVLADPISTMSLFVRKPAAGRWRLLLDFAPAVSGTALSRPYTGRITLNGVRASAAGLPNDAGITLPAGKAVTVPVKVRNTGVAPESFFVDARLNGATTVTLAKQGSPGPYPLPLLPTSDVPYWLVPTETTKIAAAVSATLPVAFDLSWLFGYGDPDVAGTSTGNTATAAYSGKPVPPGLWYAGLSEVGPFGPGGAKPGQADVTLVATTLRFDPAVSTSIGNLEKTSVDPSAAFQVVTVAPGATTTIPVTITPAGDKGTVVSGRLFVDDLSLISLPGAVPSGQELAAFPYTYTVG